MPPALAKPMDALLFKKYPGQQQVDLHCRVKVPGSWFAGGAAGALTAGEKKQHYVAVAMQFDERHVFEAAASPRARSTVERRYVCWYRREYESWVRESLV